MPQYGKIRGGSVSRQKRKADMEIVQWADISRDYHKGTILLGNGASIAVHSGFNYGALLRHVEDDPYIKNIFQLCETEDFELALRKIWKMYNNNKALDIREGKTFEVYQYIQAYLIQTVRAAHPAYRTVREHLPDMYAFLERFETVISLNYDLLIYWMRGLYRFEPSPSGHLFKDCFSRSGVFCNDWQELRNFRQERNNTLVFYPYGNLALARDSKDNEFKIRSGGDNLLNAIFDVWNQDVGIPLFVSEGTAQRKISAIKRSNYLSVVYRDVLTSPCETLTIFGWSFGEQDLHLLGQIGRAGIQRVAVSVFRDESEESYCDRVYEIAQEYLGHDIHVDFFDSESRGCWIHPA